MSQRVRKAVFPVAGLGTRFLPATKAIPKEMLPIVDRPLIQYAVDEAIAAGCDTLVFVTNRYKHPISDHFDRAYELESKLAADGKLDLLAAARDTLPAGVTTVYVTQPEALGLGHAVLCARAVIGDEPFAVILPDDLIWSEGQGAIGQMCELYAREQRSLIGVEDVPADQTDRYGIVAVEERDERLAEIRSIVEKPRPADAPSTLAVVGRYVLSPAIFDLLASTRPGAGGEIQLTDAIAALLQQEGALSYRFSGRRFDCGSKLGYVQATLHHALNDEALAGPVRRFVEQFR